MVIGLLAAACAPAPREDPDVLLELERLAFLPAAQVEVGEREFRVPRALLVDMYEVARADVVLGLSARELDERGRGEVYSALYRERAEAWPPGTAAWPASFMTQHEAARHAAQRGMRLPRFTEWVVIAVGPRRTRYPWAAIAQESVANTLQLRLRPPRPTPVGTFEGGRTPRGCYDVLGNVWEWCADGMAGGGSGSSGPGGPVSPVSPGGSGRVVAMGGSYLSNERPITPDSAVHAGFFARDLDPLGRHEDVGFRCVADAENWLETRLPELRVDAETRARLEAVGERWGPPAESLLRELAGRPGAPEAARPLYEGAARRSGR